VALRGRGGERRARKKREGREEERDGGREEKKGLGERVKLVTRCFGGRELLRLSPALPKTARTRNSRPIHKKSHAVFRAVLGLHRKCHRSCRQ